MRTGALAAYLAERGHKVIWWSSGFVHGTKEYLFKEHREIQVSDNEKLMLLYSPIAYRKNVSFSRILYHKELAKQFWKRANKEEKPDVIVCSYPTMPFAKAAIKYGKKYKVPVILDVRDEWPDIFERAFPEKIRPIGRIALWPLKYSVRRVFRAADALVGVVPAILEWALGYAGRNATKLDKAIFIGSSKPELSADELKYEVEEWENQGVSNQTWNLCCFSTLSSESSDIETMIKAVEKVSERYPEIRFVIGGSGDAFNKLCEISKNISSVVMAGWLDQRQMVSLMSISQCGVYCMKNTMDFKNAFGNKVSQYLSAGLPVLTSVTGFAKDYLETDDCGIAYIEGNVEDCVEKILYLYNQSDRQKNMSEKAKGCFYSDFLFPVVNQQFDDLIMNVVQTYKDSYR